MQLFLSKMMNLKLGPKEPYVNTKLIFLYTL